MSKRENTPPLASEPAEPTVLNELPEDPVLVDEYADIKFGEQNYSDSERREKDPLLEAKFPVHYADTTYFWHIEGDLEAAVARLYVDMKYPGSDAFVVSEIPIQMLTQQHNVIILTRPRGRHNPLIRITRNESTGQQFHDLVDPVTRLDSVRESPIIAIKPYVRDASRYSIGKFDANKFFDRAAEHMFGGHIHIQSKENVVRFIGG